MKRIRLLLLVLLGGCASAMTTADRMTSRLPETAAPEYKQGYREGCNTALVEQCMHTTGDRTRDEARMRTDKEYSIGWYDGAQACNICASSYVFVPIPK